MKANFNIIVACPEYLLIQDVGIETTTVTNDIREVLNNLHKYHSLNNRKLYYIDSYNNIDEVEHEKGVFVNFKFGCPDYVKQCLLNN